MLEQAKKIVELLTIEKAQIATMESCTGGGLANLITNVPGASEVLLYSAVTYSNEYKIKMGVSSDVIATYTVYSMETAREMAKAISDFAHSDYGVGITGTLKKKDKNNETKQDDLVYYAIYNKKKNMYCEKSLVVTKETRSENKAQVIEYILNDLEQLLKNK